MIGIIGIITITFGIDHQDHPVLTLVDHPYIDPLDPILASLFLDRQGLALVVQHQNRVDLQLANLLVDLIDLPFRDQPPDRVVIVL
jgi:hypothetical protein